ncbi:receptor protein-tyrosine kinase [Sarracenia purpurea var. burkii]
MLIVQLGKIVHISGNKSEGSALGAGEFGVVMKAEADGLLKKGVKTACAVKIAKKREDHSCMKQLASELKILIFCSEHVKHPNITNRLGASSEDLVAGSALGAGEFGVVMKAEADGLLEKGVKTACVVKIAKKREDHSCMKQLASELKIVMKAEADGLLEKGVKTACVVKIAKKREDHSCMKQLASELKILIFCSEHVKHPNITNRLGASSEDLVAGSALGAGEFGVVMKAKADGLLEKGVITACAVKIAKKREDHSCMKQLASELKILIFCS